MTHASEIVPNLEKKRISDLITHEQRLDGRGLRDYRPIKLEIGVIDKALGSAQVSLGKTKVLVGIKMESGTPSAVTEAQTLTVIKGIGKCSGASLKSVQPLLRPIDAVVKHPQHLFQSFDESVHPVLKICKVAVSIPGANLCFGPFSFLYRLRCTERTAATPRVGSPTTRRAVNPPERKSMDDATYGGYPAS